METASHYEDLNNKIAPVASEPPSSGFHLWRYGRGHFAMSLPIQNMKVRPFGEDYMFPAWMACVISIAGTPEAVKQFKEETGHDLDSIIQARGMDALIDNATGHAATVLAAWCDWITLNEWGVEE